MKSLFLLLVTFTTVFCTPHIAHGVEYKTLITVRGADVSKEIDVLPTDIVEVVSASYSGLNQRPSLSVQHVDNTWMNLGYAGHPICITGINKFRLNWVSQNQDSWVTIKITPAEAVAPTSVLVLPETPGGNYDLVVESSGDTVTWAPFHSQSVLSGGANAFFRVRIVKK